MIFISKFYHLHYFKHTLFSEELKKKQEYSDVLITIAWDAIGLSR